MDKIPKEIFCNIVEYLNLENSINLAVALGNLYIKYFAEYYPNTKIFIYGRKYQFLIDRYPVNPKLMRGINWYDHTNRFHAVRRIVGTMSQIKINENVNKMLTEPIPVFSGKTGIKRYYRLKPSLATNFDILGCRFYSHLHPKKYIYYIGRCFQFLLDTNAKITLDKIYNPIDEALALNAKIRCKPKEQMYDIKCCQNCSTYYYDDRRCSCGNRRILVNFYEYLPLDDWYEPTFEAY